MALMTLGCFFVCLILVLLFSVKIVANDLIYFGERNSINIGAPFVKFGMCTHKIGQTHGDDFVINLIFYFTQVKVNIQSRLHFSLWVFKM